ncbi:nucleotidyltransferase-like protein [Cohnella lupini]|uniref:Nucleotidyltransferase-like protein n=1 Tax=Cohnella lupini TaxID=1294267 RepID=A0A3D9I4W1_9BACL|nr:nucleotidyltransferase-like protein [Cohnella lupini]RED56711.1 nucleotidyltransferase-like protein [Cohnella lupini]
MAQSDKKTLYLEYLGKEEGVISLLLVANPFSYQPLIDGMDRLVLIVTKTPTPEKGTEHWIWNDTRILVRRVTPDILERWIVSSPNRNVIYWLLQGEVLVDRDGYLTSLRDRLMDWSPLIREQKILSEFSQFVRSYLQAKQDLRDGRVLDAYSNILASLHYWAHIALVEEGMHPELTVWEQMHRVNPGIYKLFEELTTSGETLEQRVQLVLLACEFSILNKMESSCALLIRLIESRSESWSPAELLQHPDLAGLSLELSVLLQKLVQRGCIRETAKAAKQSIQGLLELRYTSASSK